MVSVPPRPIVQAPPKLTPTVIQAAPTVYTAPPAPKKPDLRAQRQARMVITATDSLAHFLTCIYSVF